MSQLHAETANATWQRHRRRQPILGITNGVHPPTWVGGADRRAARRDLGADLDDLDDEHPADRFWERLERHPDATTSGRRTCARSCELAIFARGRLRGQFARHGEAPRCSPSSRRRSTRTILTIGFARRFATYKRAGLLFSDVDRLARLLWDEERPVQIVFAGKAHPADRPGQRVIQEIFAAVALAEAARPGLHPRGLRHPRRALPRPGRRRVAEQPAPPARGVGHAAA